MLTNEFKFIDGLAKSLHSPRPRELFLGIGDDCAVIDYSRDQYLLVSTDAFNEEVHFKRKYSTFYEAGIKAVTGGASDIYAMGGGCRYIFVSISVPSNMNERALKDFYKGVRYAAAYCGATVAGGDTTSSCAYFSTTITVLGFVRKRHLKLRSGARPGDWVYVTGPLGYSLAGLKLLERGRLPRSSAAAKALRRHKRPLPFRDGKGIFDHPAVTAMIDISDGLSSELNHLAIRSGVRIRADLEALKGDRGLAALAAELRLPMEKLILTSGEEYALLLTSGQRLTDRRLVEIGRVEKGSGFVYESRGKKERRLVPEGYDHFKSRGNNTINYIKDKDRGGKKIC
jgi:thiamine-monophosphate kinase